MIDLHCHLLHGIDDGPETMDQSLALARAACNTGITTIFATPHYRAGRFDTTPEQIRAKTAELNAELKNNQIPLQVLAGQEIRVYEGLLEDLEAGKVLPLGNSQYVLLEFSSSLLPYRFEDTLHELLIAGWRPIIAHPERNAEIAEAPEKLAELVRQGAYCQVTSHSLTGRFGRKVKSLAIEMGRRNIVHFIASDAHNETTRPYELVAAYKTAAAKIGAELADSYLSNAQAVLHNIPLEPLKPRVMSNYVRQLRLFAGWSPFKTQDGGS
ncbi:tyrosine-protein phosphatase [Paenibacillus sp. GCM10027626]|uniref:tyrosine-protein phosphatase n=1 Tax=Paenibacillus sp. GCM10027626 TaxID=3273411 RepID=UPI003639F938